MKTFHRFSLILAISLACFLAEPAWVISLGSSGYYWMHCPNQAYVEQLSSIINIEEPSGPASGIAGQSYSYTTSAINSDGNQLYYTFYWGDGSTSEAGPFDAGINVIESHSWKKAGTYQVKAKAVDAVVPQLTSGYSDPLTVIIR